MKTKSYYDISAQWKRIHALFFSRTFEEREENMHRWRLACKITERYHKNIITEYDRIHGYKVHRNLHEQFPPSVYAGRPQTPTKTEKNNYYIALYDRRGEEARMRMGYCPRQYGITYDMAHGIVIGLMIGYGHKTARGRIYELNPDGTKGKLITTIYP